MDTSAEVYKWYDEYGNLQFSDQAPTEIEAEEVYLLPAPSENTVKNAQQRVDTLVQRRNNIDTEKREEKTRIAEEKNQKKRKNKKTCDSAKTMSARLNIQRRVYIPNDTGGHYINDSDREKMKTDVQQIMKDTCQ